MMEVRKKLCSKCLSGIKYTPTNIRKDEPNKPDGGGRGDFCSDPLMLPEIVNIVFEHLESRDLKRCRFVNKTWNTEACRYLQKLTFVQIKDKEKVRNLTNMLDNIVEQGGACPFKKIQLTLTDLDREFVELMMSETIRENLSLVHFRFTPPSLKINGGSLVTVTDGGNLAENLYRILSENASTLKYFDCTLAGSMPTLAWDRNIRSSPLSSDTEISEQQRPRLKLPALRGLNFDDTDIPTFHFKWKDFLVEVIQGAPNLAILNVITFDDQVFSDIMKHADLSSLEEVFIQDFTPRHFPNFCKLELPKLRTLHLDIVHLSEDNMMTSDDLKEIVRNFSSTLQELSVNWATNSSLEGPFPYCPKLRQLTVDNWPGSLGLFNSRDLPSLDSLTVYEEIEGNVDIFLVTDPHTGVSNLRWEGNPREESGSSSSVSVMGNSTELEEKRVYTIAYLSIQFPNLRYLDLTCAASDEMIRTIVTHLPELEILELTTECSLSESVFTGINRYTLLHFIDAGVSIEKCVRSTSLTDMQHLKKLAVHSYESKGFPLTNNAVIFGLSEMPALEFLHIDWTEELDAQIVIRNLNHLTSLVIKHSEETRNEEIFKEMKQTMSQIKFEPELGTITEP